ncbi:sugar phosphate isomerase/epimerase family protein [Paractinoplanes durhamensis]|uniref:Xylose isomerase n=1 Tax=Paractinoplanes durhamensis TaxID=113563 RepID=A0ABQ3YU19_9ACTN|nr:TIM barrel protein [Actinoplanes durhamensis]GIE01078.1 xylose isomerase [Actinoplanes durhamensis]
MTDYPRFGAGLWHFATYVDRYASDGYGPSRTTLDAIELAGQVEDLSVVDLNYPFTPGVGLSEVKDALAAQGLTAIGITPEIYLRRFAKGAFTNPDPGVRKQALDLMHEAAGVVREIGADYVKIWPGQDGWDYPFQVDHRTLWKLAVDGMRELAGAHPDLKFAIEYKPREPRVKMTWDSAARSILGIQQIGLDNVGVLLDFGHSLYGGESPADAAQLLIDHGLLYGMDVNDNLRGWDDDLVVGTVHLTEIFEYFYTLRKNNWEGVWQLDQFPFREDSVDAARTSIGILKRLYRALDRLDTAALAEAQERQDAMAAQRLVQEALFGAVPE